MIRTNGFYLFLGDLAVFVGALFIALALRYGAFPNQDILTEHLRAFAGIFVLWILVFFIAGLYDVQVTVARKRIPVLVLKAQFVNMLLAVLIFFLFPVGITPKITLVLYFIVSIALVTLWRLFVYPLFATRRSIRTLIVGTGSEVERLAEVLNQGPYFGFMEVSIFDPHLYLHEKDLEQALIQQVDERHVSLIVGDMRMSAAAFIPLYYNLTFLHRDVAFMSVDQLYEEVFYRIPSSLIEQSWLLENISRSPHYVYDILKRAFDVCGAVLLGILSLPLFPIIAACIRQEDGGTVLYKTTRVGRFGKPIDIVKFRTMSGQDVGQEALQSSLVITRTGQFLRRTRLDELPQLWNILRGDISFIGPRPEMPALAKIYSEHIPHYAMRSLITPGLSGWAQIYHETHPHHGTNIEETKVKLSYDLYYLKQRSFLLDIEIALKTLKTLLLRSGA